ncbi:MAG TPA: 4-(cytidine 5'-diphospho)-2-C-methyl-D-erythritol kinase [Pirellulaceae bacterium]
MHVRRLATCVEVQTPAKLNLFLEVLGKRGDGYHEIETLIVGLGLYDTLIFTPKDTHEITLHCRWALGATAERNRTEPASAIAAINDEIPSGPQNLVWRAVELLRNEADVRGGASLELVKRIPAAAGLGGGSSDAAAALVAANLGWQLNWPRERLVELAAKIGSDVPFFLVGGAAICRGRGERIERTAARRLHTVVVRPPVGISTADVYKACQVADKRATVDRIQSALAHGAPAEIARLMTNRLHSAAEGLTPWIEELKTRFEGEDELGHQMSGSGSSYFGICRSARSARRVAARLRARRSGAVFAATTAAAMK